MRIQLHIDIQEEDGRLWYKRYFIEGFPCLPNLYNFIEVASILNGVEEDEQLLTTADKKVYYVSQIVWLKDESGIYPLVVCSEREAQPEGQ